MCVVGATSVPDMIYTIEKECYCCEVNFTVLADADDVEFCPFCGEPLGDDYSDLDDEQEDTD